MLRQSNLIFLPRNQGAQQKHVTLAGITIETALKHLNKYRISTYLNFETAEIYRCETPTSILFLISLGFSIFFPSSTGWHFKLPQEWPLWMTSRVIDVAHQIGNLCTRRKDWSSVKKHGSMKRTWIYFIRFHSMLAWYLERDMWCPMISKIPWKLSLALVSNRNCSSSCNLRMPHQQVM